jgi:hypothetical protein
MHTAPVEGGSLEAGSEPAAGVPTQKSDEERNALLAEAIASEEGRGWRLESQSDFQAVMVRERRSIYLLRVLVAMFAAPQEPSYGSERREVIVVDEYGDTDILS